MTSLSSAFLNIEEHCNPRTLLNRKRAGASTGFQLGRTIDDLTAEIADIRGTENDQMEVVRIFLSVHTFNRVFSRSAMRSISWNEALQD